MNRKNLIPYEEVRELMIKDFGDREEFERLVAIERKKNREEYYREIGEQIEHGRKAAGITQEELAKKLNTKKSAISRIESGKQNISIGMLEKICKAIGRPYRISVEIF